MTGEFEDRHGFPSGTNEVRPADHDDRAAARRLAQVTFTPAGLVTFYDSIGEVDWAGPDAEPFLNGCPERIARLIFDEVAEACDPTDRAVRDAARTTTGRIQLTCRGRTSSAWACCPGRQEL
ncbi:hypothetical protein ACWER6_30385 [Streptomyces sp. NPDC004009]